MVPLHLHTPWASDITLVPNRFLDEHMFQANGEFVKIYLYMLRCAPDSLPSLSLLADKMSCTERDILRAIRYWEKEGLLQIGLGDEQKISDISFVYPQSSPAPAQPLPELLPPAAQEAEPAQAKAAAKNAPVTSEPSVHGADLQKTDLKKADIQGAAAQKTDSPETDTPTAKLQDTATQETDSAKMDIPGPGISETDISKDPDGSALPPSGEGLNAERAARLKENAEVVQFLYIAEQYLARPLTSTDTNKILYFYENLNFSAELIEFLIEYCVSKNHKSIHYIEKVALSWAEQGISTVAAAKEETRQYSQTYFTIFKALGIQNRNPVEAEIQMMDRWLQEWAFTMDLILEACKRTVMQTGSGSFAYTDKILREWHAAKVRHIVDLETADAEHKAKKAKSAKYPKSNAKKKTAAPNRFSDYPHRDYDFDQIKKSMFEQ